MNSIFWKIFLSFWVVMVAIVGITLQISLQLANERSAQVNDLRRIDILRGAENALDEGGKRGFLDWLKNTAVLPPAQTVYLIDDAGNDILDRTLPKELRAAFKRHRKGRGRAARMPRISAPDGKEYLFIFGRTKPPMLGVLSAPGVHRLVFLLALMISAAVCFVLTRYLTAPLRPVMRAAGELAGGDLKARTNSPHYRHDELGRLAQQFDTMADALQQQVETRQDLLRNVSHELRSPVARIQVALELARRQPQQLDLQLERIEHEALHMEGLTAQMLDLARAQATEAPGEPHDLIDVLRNVCDDANFEGKPGNKTVTLSTSSDAVFVAGQRTLLHSAIENVIRNALRFTPLGGGVKLTLTHDEAAARVTLSVTDQGPGVDPEKLRRIFDPFYTAGNDAVGSGVGLAVSAQIIKMHAGTITARNLDDRSGLEVLICLPTTTPTHS